MTYLIWSNEHRAWWNPKSSGYTKNLDRAGRYNRAEALVICSGARDGWGASDIPSEIPVLEDDVLKCREIDVAKHAAIRAAASR